MNKIKNNIIEQFNCYINELPKDTEIINPNALGNSIYRQYLIDLKRIVGEEIGLNVISYYTTEGVEITIAAGQIRAFFQNEINEVNEMEEEEIKNYPKDFEERMVDHFKIKSKQESIEAKR